MKTTNHDPRLERLRALWDELAAISNRLGRLQDDYIDERLFDIFTRYRCGYSDLVTAMGAAGAAAQAVAAECCRAGQSTAARPANPPVPFDPQTVAQLEIGSLVEVAGVDRANALMACREKGQWALVTLCIRRNHTGDYPVFVFRLCAC